MMTSMICAFSIKLGLFEIDIIWSKPAILFFKTSVDCSEENKKMIKIFYWHFTAIFVLNIFIQMIFKNWTAQAVI